MSDALIAYPRSAVKLVIVHSSFLVRHLVNLHL